MKLCVAPWVALLLTGCVSPPPPHADPPPKSDWIATASAAQESIFPAAYVCDGRRDTRWSSPATDPQWVQIDMGRPATLCGMTILWETAFSIEYVVEVSEDGERWRKAFSTAAGDGNTDYIHFSPVVARFVRVTGLKRATGWGHSIWEIDLHGPSEQMTEETVRRNGRTVTTIDLHRELPLGGLRIEWGKSFAASLDYDVSTDGMTWTRLGELRDGTGGFDVLMHPVATARFLRLDMEGPADIRSIALRGPDEVITPLAEYQLAAEKARPGLYPDSLRKRQVFWTVVGEPDAVPESLIDEYGNIEPAHHGCSIMPYIFTGGRLISAFDAGVVTQALDSGYLPLPSVTWLADGLRLDVEALAAERTMQVRYTLRNVSRGPQTGRLFLAIRPVQINPPWQFGGLSHIRSLELRDGAVLVNGEMRFVTWTEPGGFGVRAFDRGDVIRELVHGQLPADAKLDHAGELISGALAYDFNLQPGGTCVVRLAAPLGGPVGAQRDFDVLRDEQRARWTGLVDHVVMELPDSNLVNAIKSHIGWVLVNRDGPAIQPGARQYERSWIRDGALTSVSLLRLGVTETVREYIDWYAHFVQPNGMVPPSFRADDALDCGPGSGLEYDGQGLFNYMVMEYYRFTGDTNFLAAHFEKMHRSMKFMADLRRQTLEPGYMVTNPPAARFVDIFPRSYSHEGYDPPMHSYWDDIWGLQGWKDGAEAARILGREDVAVWAESEYRALRDGVKASIRATMEAKQIAHVPGCAEKGDFDPSASAIALSPCDERELVSDETWQATLDRYHRDLMARFEPGWSAGFCPYEARIISSFVELGQKDRALELLDYLMNCRRPANWNHWAEVAYGEPRMASYIGDMPHTWAGSGIVNGVREMLIRETGGKLILLQGVPEKWLRDGNGIRLGGMPTWFGAVDVRARMTERRATIELGGTANPPDGFEIFWPVEGKPSRVAVDGKSWGDYDATSCRVPAGTREIAAEW